VHEAFARLDQARADLQAAIVMFDEAGVASGERWAHEARERLARLQQPYLTAVTS
jgi:hypothetical protein